jgi:hypothetical protein
MKKIFTTYLLTMPFPYKQPRFTTQDQIKLAKAAISSLSAKQLQAFHEKLLMELANGISTHQDM